MIYYIDTEGLMEKYSKRSEDEIENTNYLIFSSHILNTDPRPNVYNIYNMFMSLDILKGVDIRTDVHSLKAREEFKSYLMRQPKIMLFLINIILNDLSSLENTLIIMTPNEKKGGNIQVFMDVINNIFAYKISEYPNVAYSNPEETLKRLEYYESEATDLAFDLEPQCNKASMLRGMSKSDIKRLMNKKGLEYHGLDRNEMIATLLEAY